MRFEESCALIRSFVNNMDETSSVMNYDVRYVYKMHGRALKKIDELLERRQ